MRFGRGWCAEGEREPGDHGTIGIRLLGASQRSFT
jgi:hypothetical protein